MECLLLKWGPKNDHLLLLALLLILSNSSLAYITANLERVCTRDEDLRNDHDLQPDSHFFRQRSMVLEGRGERSAALLFAKMSDSPCALVVEVPKDTHAIAISISSFPKSIPCPLSLWFQDSINKNETWFLDLCDRERKLLALPEVYPPRITLRWNAKMPASYPKNDTRLVRVLSSEERIEIVVTAVARGPLCDEETQVLCWKIMKESLCISEEFVCDGRKNCPQPGNEESESMCPQRRNGDSEQPKVKSDKAWDILAEHLKRILAVKSGDREMIKSDDSKSSRRSGGVVFRRSGGIHLGGGGGGGAAFADSSEEDESAEEDGEAKRRSGFFGALPPLGPGSYVLLGMLTFGSVLLLCGIWECCCRVRNRSATISISQRGSLVTSGTSGQGTTTTVVIISSTPPPQYEDLEQPPNYKELFPLRPKPSGI